MALNIVAVGDSNTANSGWPEALQVRLTNLFPGTTVNVTKQAFGGITTHEMLTTYIPNAIATNPDVIVMMSGTNESYYDVGGDGYGLGVNGVDYSETGFRARLESIANLVDAANNGSVATNGKILFLVMTPPPAATTGDGWTYTRPRIASYASVVRAFANARNLPLVDVYNKILGNRDWKNAGIPSLVMTTDGVHFNSYGYRYVAETVQEVLRGYQNTAGYIVGPIKGTIYRVLFVGDSITWGDYSGGTPNWAERLIDNLTTSYPTVAMDAKNMGVGGASGFELSSRAQTVIYENVPDIVFVMYGFNDAYKEHNGGPVDGIPAFEAAYRSVLSALAVFNNGSGYNGNRPRVVLASPPGCLGAPFGVTNTDLSRYTATVAALAAEYGVTYVNVYGLNLQGNPANYTDTIHPASGTGSPLIYAAVREALVSLIDADLVVTTTAPPLQPTLILSNGASVVLTETQGAFVVNTSAGVRFAQLVTPSASTPVLVDTSAGTKGVA